MTDLSTGCYVRGPIEAVGLFGKKAKQVREKLGLE